MELPDQAARALEVIRRDGRDLRFEVAKICESTRYRLSVHYRPPHGGEFRLGLLYSEDREALERLRDALAVPSAGASSGQIG